jgi:hypothetical protein
MPIAQVFFTLIRRTPPPVGQTLAKLGNGRTSASRSLLLQHHTIVQNNGTIDSRTIKSNISPLDLADNVAMLHNE